MNIYFDSFKEEIESVRGRLAQGDMLAEQAQLVLLGRIGYAVERGDLTAKEAIRLDSLLGEVRRKYGQALELANGRDPVSA